MRLEREGIARLAGAAQHQQRVANRRVRPGQLPVQRQRVIDVGNGVRVAVRVVQDAAHRAMHEWVKRIELKRAHHRSLRFGGTPGERAVEGEPAHDGRIAIAKAA